MALLHKSFVLVQSCTLNHKILEIIEIMVPARTPSGGRGKVQP